MPSKPHLSYKNGMDTTTSWANYDAKNADNDATEKDLFFCVNSNANFDKFRQMCGMERFEIFTLN